MIDLVMFASAAVPVSLGGPAEIWGHIVNDFANIAEPAAFSAFLQVLMIDLVLAGDNAIVVGALAAGLPAAQRKKVIVIGVVAALVLRIVFALMVSWLLGIVGLVLAGRFFINPLLRLTGRLGERELFVVVGLFTVIASAAVMEALHLSTALGAFIAGVMLADSPYRHEIEADVEPFRSILLGLFFMGGYYVDRLVRTPAGWRIAERTEELSWSDRHLR